MNANTKEVTKEELKGNTMLALTLLQTEHPHALPLVVEESDSSYLLHANTDDMAPFGVLGNLPLEEKLRYLINIGKLQETFGQSVYTYALHPENLMFTQNGIVKVVYRGVINQVPPYKKLNVDDFLENYKSIIISVLDRRVDFDELSQGKLNFYKGHKFCEAIVNSETIDDVLNLLKEHLAHEKERVKKEMIRVPQRQLLVWKIGAMISSALLLILSSIFLYNVLITQPQQQNISNLRLAFTKKDYSKVVSSVKTIDSKSLSVDDKYLVAYSVIMTESLTDAQKTTLGKITNQTNEDYLRYWVLIGQNKIDEAMDIASFLDDPQLVMYGITKKIDEVQRDPSLSSDKRTEELNRYKSKLDEMKKQFLPARTPTKNP